MSWDIRTHEWRNYVDLIFYIKHLLLLAVVCACDPVQAGQQKGSEPAVFEKQFDELASSPAATLWRLPKHDHYKDVERYVVFLVEMSFGDLRIAFQSAGWSCIAESHECFEYQE